MLYVWAGLFAVRSSYVTGLVEVVKPYQAPDRGASSEYISCARLAVAD